MFSVIPAIDMRGGRCVRLVEGDFARETVFATEPARVAAEFVRAGAQRIHMVDLDGAKDGAPAHLALVRAAVDAGANVQVGGGIRDLATIATYVEEVGVRWVILGTAAVRRPDLVASAAKRYGDRVLVGIDARDGMVAVNGWLEVSQTRASDLARAVASAGAAGIIYTDIRRDGTGKGPNVAATTALAQACGIPVVASGGVSSMAHLTALAAVRPGLAGVVVGSALYKGQISLEEALAVGRPGAPVAE